jgi:hypothetical protein
MNENNELRPQPVPETPEQPDIVPEADLPMEEPRSEPVPAEEISGEPDPAPGKDDVKKPKEKAEKKPPTRFQLGLRKGLIGLGIVALIFLAGLLTDHFVRYKPLADTLDTTRTDLEEANQAVSDLEAENERLVSSNQAAQEAIEALEDELSGVRANALFYQVLVDVNAARIALFMEDIEGAQGTLVDTQDNLEALLPAIEDVDPDLALSLPRRLELIVSGLERDPETGLIDLELFTKDLLELEPLLAVD